MVDSCQPNSHGIWRFFIQRNNGRFLEVNAVFTVFLFCFFCFFREEKKVSYWLLTMDWLNVHRNTIISINKNEWDRIPTDPGTSKLRSGYSGYPWTPKPWKRMVLNPPKYGLYPLKMKEPWVPMVLRLFRGGPWVRGLSRLEISWIVKNLRTEWLGFTLWGTFCTTWSNRHRHSWCWFPGGKVVCCGVYLWNDWVLPKLNNLNLL